MSFKKVKESYNYIIINGINKNFYNFKLGEINIFKTWYQNSTLMNIKI